VLAIPLHSVPIAPLHLSGFGPDDFICIGLIALVLVIATFVVRGGEKAKDENTTQASSESSAKK
jgi:hypothetical protein